MREGGKVGVYRSFQGNLDLMGRSVMNHKTIVREEKGVCDCRHLSHPHPPYIVYI